MLMVAGPPARKLRRCPWWWRALRKRKRAREPRPAHSVALGHHARSSQIAARPSGSTSWYARAQQQQHARAVAARPSSSTWPCTHGSSGQAGSGAHGWVHARQRPVRGGGQLAG
ncbi:hypothetical protein ZWY2020_009663 [Hordeum vulgare]|nr:hypothetical protein ZWY2020_009663 [Hordeum vulgare]